MEFKFLSQESDGDDDPFKITRSKVKKAPINHESSRKTHKVQKSRPRKSRED